MGILCQSPYWGSPSIFLLARPVLLIDARNIDIDPQTELFQHISLQICRGSSELEITGAGVVARICFSKLPRINRNGYCE
jgi:hypothetical protein